MKKSTALKIMGIMLFFAPMIIFSVWAAKLQTADLPEYQVPCILPYSSYDCAREDQYHIPCALYPPNFGCC